MWEFSICASNSNKQLINYIADKLKKTSDEIGYILTVVEDCELCSLVFACEEYDKKRVEFYISEGILDCICKKYKEIYLSKILKLNEKNEIISNALKKALISFDKETDRYIVSKSLVIEHNLNLDSLFAFKLKYLKEKWSELARIANENCVFYESQDTFIELIKFLVDNLEIENDIINVIGEKGSYKYFGENFQELELNNIIKNNEIDVLINLISLCPKKVYIYTDNMDSEIFSLVKQIFYKRVTFLPYEKLINKRKINQI